MNEQKNNLDQNIIDRKVNNGTLEEKTVSKKSSKALIFVIVAMFVLIAGGIIFYMINNNSQNNIKTNAEVKKSAYWISGNSLENFDLRFLQLENKKENKIYSPLSIKYALGMLREGAEGESKSQISSVIGDYKINNYVNSKNMSFANAFFIKDTYKQNIKESFSADLTNKYNSEVKVDSFKTPDVVNSWIHNKTLGLIDKLYDDVSTQDVLLINALAIDMDWNEKFITYSFGAQYSHESFAWYPEHDILSRKFENNSEEVAGMEIIASFNNYDIVNVLGEKKIRETVKKEFNKWLKENETDISTYFSDDDEENDSKKLSDDQLMQEYLDGYIEEINKNYKAEDKTTEFSFYVDDNVKAFAKDLKEYDGITLEYVGIMPTKESLDSYINKITSSDISNIITNLKELKRENFKDGVVTKITGFIPKFKIEYKLDLMNDLKTLGIKNVFEQGKANLVNLSKDKSLFINDASHKANIEFTQDGIKAAAVTGASGYGNEGAFDYLFDVPVEEIDLTFDKPYMFIIRDKKTGEVWFAGTVYNPLPYSQDTTKVPME